MIADDKPGSTGTPGGPERKSKIQPERPWPSTPPPEGAQKQDVLFVRMRAENAIREHFAEVEKQVRRAALSGLPGARGPGMHQVLPPAFAHLAAALDRIEICLQDLLGRPAQIHLVVEEKPQAESGDGKPE